MTPEERLQTAICLGKPDRIPCAPLIESYAGRFAGFSNYEYMYDYKKALRSWQLLKERYPLWDVRRSIYSYFFGPCQKVTGLLKTMMPGIDIPEDREFQVVEYEAISRKDYELILEAGYDIFLTEYLKRLHDVTEKEIAQAIQTKKDLIKFEIADARKMGQAFLYGGVTVAAPVTVSLMRSMEQFVRDMFQIPSLLEKVIEKVNTSIIQEGIEYARDSGIPRIFIGLPRVSGQFMSDKFFDRFVWPYVKEMILQLINAGINPVLHLDSDWSKNIPKLLELPAGKIIVELDSATDIFLTHKTLSGHSCILGDVSPMLLSIGTPEQVKDYCRKLLIEIGQDGGFIFSSGCTVPLCAKHENVEAFFQSMIDFEKINS